MKSETVLVVEDEQKIREMIRRFLQAKNYCVLEAASGEDALSICDTHKKNIHLVITDIVMQGMSGFEFVERLKLVQPKAKVLFMSGYTDHAVFQEEVPMIQSIFLMKPFTSDLLTEKVREVLDS